ncbi:MAG: MbnH family di-heme enzyme [Myxococcota bacterium]
MWFFLLGCESASVREVLQVPEHIETPAIPEANLPTEASIELGRWLFYDERLSGNGTQSCASCHVQELAFADGQGRPVGSTGDAIPRNSQGLANVAWARSLTWAHPGLVDLEQQIHVPLRSQEPIELGMNDGNEQRILSLLEDDPEMMGRFEEAFPSARREGISTPMIVNSLASCLRSMVSFDSPYDRFIAGDTDAISESAQRGFSLFNGHPMECFHCHTGTLLTTSYRDVSSNAEPIPPEFHNTGLYNVDGSGSYPAHDQGLFEVTGDFDDRGRYRVPSLRNVALTAPYMHDGSIPTLREAVLHYANGGRFVEDGPHAGDGRLNPLKSALVRGFPITEQELEDVVAFLETLTDTRFTTDPRFSDPEEVP